MARSWCGNESARMNSSSLFRWWSAIHNEISDRHAEIQTGDMREKTRELVECHLHSSGMRAHVRIWYCITRWSSQSPLPPYCISQDSPNQNDSLTHLTSPAIKLSSDIRHWSKTSSGFDIVHWFSGFTILVITLRDQLMEVLSAQILQIHNVLFRCDTCKKKNHFNSW